MDINALNHEYHKVMVDATNVTTVRNTDGDSSSPPPAYTQYQPSYESGSDGTLDEDDDDDDDYEDLYSNPGQTRSTTRSRSRSHTPESLHEGDNVGDKSIHINNKITVLGSQNIVSTAPLDSMRWTASILAILNGNRPLPCQEQQQQQRAAAVQAGQPPNVQSIFALRGGPVNILIDCSVQIVGSRNIVGVKPAAAVHGAAVAARGNVASQTQNRTAHAATVSDVANDSNINRSEPPAAPQTPPGGADSTALPHSHSKPPPNSPSHHAHPSVSLPRSPRASSPHQRPNQPVPANDSKKRKHSSDNPCSLALPPPVPVATLMGSGAVATNPVIFHGSQTGAQNSQLSPHLPAPASSHLPAPAHPGVIAAMAAQLAEAGTCESAPAGADVANGDADGPDMRARKRTRRGEGGDGVADSGDGEGDVGGDEGNDGTGA